MKNRKFGQKIRKRRRQLDLTQKEVARRIKASIPYVGHLENGIRRPSDETIERLARVLGFDSLDLLHLVNPQRRALLDPETDRASNSMWQRFQNDKSLQRILKISTAEMTLLSCVALLGEFRSLRDIVHLLDTVR